MKKIALFICIATVSIAATAQNRAERNVGRDIRKNVEGDIRRNVEREIKRIVIDDDKQVRPPQINENLGRGMVFRGTFNMGFEGIPNLTEEQKTKLTELQTAFGKENRRADNLINEKRARLRTLQDEDVIDQNAVNKTIDELTALQAAKMKAQVEHRIKVRSLLTPEQREVYNQSNGRVVFWNNLGRMRNF